MNLRNLLPIGRTVEPSGERSGRFRPAAPGLLPDFSKETPVANRSVASTSVPDPSPSPSPSPLFATAPRHPTTVATSAIDAQGRDSAGSRDGTPAPAGLDSGRDGGGGRGRPNDQGRGKPTGKPTGHPTEKAGRRLPLWLEQWIWALLRSGNRRRGTRPVQGELFAEPVKVAKNDLMTADVEVVVRAAAASAATPPTKPKPKPKAMSATCRARLLGLWWAPVARRLGRWGGRSREL